VITKRILKQYEDRLAITCSDGASYRYADLLQHMEEIDSKINHRTLVFCLCENTIGSLIGYLSFITSDIVPLMLDSSLDRELLEGLISTYRPEYLWLPNDGNYIHLPSQIVFSYLGYSLLKMDNIKLHEMDKNLALLLTTSGSTGSPKLVRLSYSNIYANAKSIANYLSIDREERPITLLPMNYSFGLSIINSHLIMGANLLLSSHSVIEKDFWIFLKNQKATSISGIPYTYEILKKLRLFQMDLPSITTFTQAGGKLDHKLNREVSEYCLQTGKRFFVMYGQTEATARMSYLPPKYSLSKLGSMGIAIPGGSFSLIDEKGQTFEEENIAGELVYRGKNVCMGYAECISDLNKVDENSGVLFTGDIAKRDKDNFYYIVGRKKRFIKLYGNRINLDETERILKTIIPESACVGVDDRMIIFIVDSTKIREVQQYVSSKTGINSNAFEVKCISRIPKNSAGKTIYSELKI
jgi:long-chain acyl-CoA synthetase